ncbi:Uncharacterised protein [Klebsiella variicola]|uniref:Uncharacterized protein n=1 Tax=Klebsiella variicola TaxID=244366 RepID=A0A7H4MGN9_KLEVA|nr:Uncharacterised protein [Klebsiella variicola]
MRIVSRLLIRRRLWLIRLRRRLSGIRIVSRLLIWRRLWLIPLRRRLSGIRIVSRLLIRRRLWLIRLAAQAERHTDRKSAADTAPALADTPAAPADRHAEHKPAADTAPTLAGTPAAPAERHTDRKSAADTAPALADTPAAQAEQHAKHKPAADTAPALAGTPAAPADQHADRKPAADTAPALAGTPAAGNPLPADKQAQRPDGQPRIQPTPVARQWPPLLHPRAQRYYDHSATDRKGRNLQGARRWRRKTGHRRRRQAHRWRCIAPPLHRHPSVCRRKAPRRFYAPWVGKLLGQTLTSRQRAA